MIIKLFRLIIVVCLPSLLTACANSGNTIVEDMIEIEEIESETTAMEEDGIGAELGDFIPIEIEQVEKDYSALDDIEVDEDISILPTSLAYAQTTRMMFDMEPYEGLTVKIKGMYYHEVIEELDIDRKTIMLMDETSCCQGYFEIELPDGADYPENGQQMMIIGKYTVVQSGEYSYPVIEVTDYIY